MKKERKQSNYNLDFYELDVLLFTLRQPEVKKIFTNQAQPFGYDKKEAQEMFSQLKEKLIRQFVCV